MATSQNSWCRCRSRSYHPTLRSRSGFHPSALYRSNPRLLFHSSNYRRHTHYMEDYQGRACWDLEDLSLALQRPLRNSHQGLPRERWATSMPWQQLGNSTTSNNNSNNSPRRWQSCRLSRPRWLLRGPLPPRQRPLWTRRGRRPSRSSINNSNSSRQVELRFLKRTGRDHSCRAQRPRASPR